jgi:hypothetical protein
MPVGGHMAITWYAGCACNGGAVEVSWAVQLAALCDTAPVLFCRLLGLHGSITGAITIWSPTWQSLGPAQQHPPEPCWCPAGVYVQPHMVLVCIGLPPFATQLHT